MKTSIQFLLTSTVVAVIFTSAASSITSCSKKSDDPNPTSSTPSTFVPVVSATGVQLGDQNNSSFGSFFGSGIGNPYTSGSGSFVANISKINIAFALQPNNSTSATPQLISPSAINYSTGFNANVSTISGKNTTYFGIPSTAPAFSSISGSTLSQLSTSTSFTATSTGLSLNGTYFYKTFAGKVGVIFVTSLSSNGNSNNSSTSNSVTFSFIEVQ